MGQPPEGFVYDGNVRYARLIFPEREQVRQRGYYTMRDPHSGITITQYRGSTSKIDAIAAKREVTEMYPRTDYGHVEQLEIDDRVAWGWLETNSYKGEISNVDYNIIVSYPEATYTIEFHAGELKYQDEELQKKILSSFFVADKS